MIAFLLSFPSLLSAEVSFLQSIDVAEMKKKSHMLWSRALLRDNMAVKVAES